MRYVSHLDTFSLGKADPGFLPPNDKDITFAGGKRVVDGVFDMDDAEAAIVSFSVRDDPDATHVTTTRRHGDDARVELDEVGDLASA